MRAWVSSDYYAVLGVPKAADSGVIKKAYKVLARQHHPDHGGSVVAFHEISEAYKVLSNPALREQYDTVRKVSGAETFATDSVLSDLFKEAFKEGFTEGVEQWKKGKLNQGLGHDVQTKTTIKQSELDAGEKTVTMVFQSGCFSCLSGCEQCENGWVVEEKTLKVRIPAGIKDGQKIKIKGAGGKGEKGNGDLYLKVSLELDVVKPQTEEQVKPSTQNGDKSNPDKETVTLKGNNNTDMENLGSSQHPQRVQKNNPEREQEKPQSAPVSTPKTAKQSRQGPTQARQNKPPLRKPESVPFTKSETSGEKFNAEGHPDNRKSADTSAKARFPGAVKNISSPPRRSNTLRKPHENKERNEYVKLEVGVESLGRPVSVYSPRGEALSFVLPEVLTNGQVLRIKNKGKVNPETLSVEDLLIKVIFKA